MKIRTFSVSINSDEETKEHSLLMGLEETKDGEVMTLVAIGQYADDKSCATAVAEAIERELAK